VRKFSIFAFPVIFKACGLKEGRKWFEDWEKIWGHCSQ